MKRDRMNLYLLVDQLPTKELPAARRYLQYLRDLGDPLLAALGAAPEEDEVVSAEEDAAADQAWQEYRRGKGRPWSQVRRGLIRG